jgi:hypothetical protein
LGRFADLNITVTTELEFEQGPAEYEEITLVTGLGLLQTFDIDQTVFHVTVTTTLAIGQKIANLITESVETEFELEPILHQTFPETLTADLTLTAEPTAVLGWTLETDLGIVAAPTTKLDIAGALETDLTLCQRVSFVQVYADPTYDVLCNFDPMIGYDDCEGTPTPPAGVAPTLGDASLTLTYPFVTPTVTVTLPNADWGDRDRQEFQRVHRNLRGGAVVIFAEDGWPEQRVLTLDIDGMDETQAGDLLDFLLTSLGAEIGLLDHENRQWRGILLNPEAEITQTQREGSCEYAVSLEFEGELV